MVGRVDRGPWPLRVMSKMLMQESLPAKKWLLDALLVDALLLLVLSKRRECGVMYASVRGLMSGYEAIMEGEKGERRRRGRERGEVR